jgi:hypothetical protein
MTVQHDATLEVRFDGAGEQAFTIDVFIPNVFDVRTWKGAERDVEGVAKGEVIGYRCLA